jgi:hypothetical protein
VCINGPVDLFTRLEVFGYFALYFLSTFLGKESEAYEITMLSVCVSPQ